jgi:hypothetical protein
VGINLREIPDILIARIALSNTEHLLIALTLIGHLEQADGTYFHHAARKAGSVHQDECIERIAIVAQRRRDKAIVSGVMHRRIEVSVQPEDMEFLVVLVLVDSLEWNLDDGIDHFRRFCADRKLKIVGHKEGVVSFHSKDRQVSLPSVADTQFRAYRATEGWEGHLHVYNQAR